MVFSNEGFKGYIKGLLQGVRKEVELTVESSTITGLYTLEFPTLLHVRFFVENGERITPRVEVLYKFPVGSVGALVEVRIDTYKPDGRIKEVYQMSQGPKDAVRFILSQVSKKALSA